LLTAPSQTINRNQGWVAMRVRMGQPSTYTTNYPRFFEWQVDASHYLGAYINGPNLYAYETPDGVAAQVLGSAYSVGTYKTVIIKWTASNLTGSIDGGSFAAGQSRIVLSGAASSSFQIGRDNTAANLLNGDVLWLAAGTGTLTNSDATSINAFGNSDPKTSHFPSSAAATFVWNASGQTGSLK
jgi:hypothetical protein